MPGLSMEFVLGSALWFSAVFQVNAQAVTNGAACTKKFNTGTEEFVLDTQDAVNAGATFISSPTVTQVDDCVSACCEIPQCNLALIENGQEKGSVKTCYLFDCLYRNEYVCRFVNNVGFTNYIPETVYERYLGGPEISEKNSPIAFAGPDIVVQPNDWVSLNGIESKAKDDKVISKYEWSLLKGDTSVVIQKTALPDQVQLSDLQPGVYEFQLKVTDSKGLTDTAQVTVLVLTPEQSDHHCLVPKKVGPCRGSFPRWHYNAASEECEEFTYGGCMGNHNNYISVMECTNACKGVQDATGRIGPLPTEGEVCGVPCKPWQFVCNSGCCLSKTLECDAVAHCTDGSDETSCHRLNETFSRLLNVDVDHKRVRCTEPPKTGPCRASHTRWYYDPLNKKCYRFTFGGCEGNENNFEQEDICSSTCDGVTDKHVFARGMFEYYEDEGTESGSIAIAILLALAILAVLAILGYCFLKKRKDQTQHQPVTTHVPFEDRDTMVYNSTTKPV